MFSYHDRPIDFHIKPIFDRHDIALFIVFNKTILTTGSLKRMTRKSKEAVNKFKFRSWGDAVKLFFLPQEAQHPTSLSSMTEKEVRSMRRHAPTTSNADSSSTVQLQFRVASDSKCGYTWSLSWMRNRRYFLLAYKHNRITKIVSTLQQNFAEVGTDLSDD